jgi:hypothetical protein
MHDPDLVLSVLFSEADAPMHTLGPFALGLPCRQAGRRPFQFQGIDSMSSSRYNLLELFGLFYFCRQFWLRRYLRS